MTLAIAIHSRLTTQGPMRAQELIRLGASPEQLRRWVAKGDLVHPARGLYALPTQEVGEYHSLVEACLRSSLSVVCLLSALAFHKVTTQNPAEIWLAIPQGSRTPQWQDVDLRVIHLTERFHAADVETHTLSNGSVRVYSLSRTLVDAFRFRGLIGLDVALEAIREATRSKRVSWDELYLAAKGRGVGNSIRPYLEAM